MPQACVNGVSLAYEEFGRSGQADQQTVLLIHGLGVPCSGWPESVVKRFTDCGYRVIAPDNRDVGQSQKFDELGVPSIAWRIFKYRIGLNVAAPYSLLDMANDLVALLEHLSVEAAHVVGVSMGGMIAQNIAVHHPSRVLTLTSAMSSTNNRALPEARKSLAKHMLNSPRNDVYQANFEHTVESWRRFAGAKYPGDHEQRKRFVQGLFARGISRTGTVRQLAAVFAEKDRRALLKTVSAPTLIVHGDDDPLIDVSAGIDTANAIPESTLYIIEGMGHDIPQELVTQICERIMAHFALPNEAYRSATMKGSI